MTEPVRRCIYNEFALQFELGFFFREKGYDVYFERNISTFDNDSGTDSQPWVKHEIDLVIERDGARYAIELKFPRNGEYPEQMYCFLKDILFMEQVRDRAKFDGTYTLTVVIDPLFYLSSSSKKVSPSCSQVYSFFRTGDKGEAPRQIPARFKIYKPTGKKSHCITMTRPHMIEWKKSDAPWDSLSKGDKKGTFHYYICIC